MRQLVVIAAVALLAPVTAAAQSAPPDATLPGATPPSEAPPGETSPAPFRPSTAPETFGGDPPEYYDPSTAVLLSVGGTVGGFALAYATVSSNDDLWWVGAAGLAVGPSLGRWYSGRAGLAGIGLRTAGMAIAFAGLISALDQDGEDGAAPVLMFGGAGLYAVSTLYDVFTSGEIAREANAERANRIVVAPTVGRGQAGLLVSGAF